MKTSSLVSELTALTKQYAAAPPDKIWERAFDEFQASIATKKSELEALQSSVDAVSLVLDQANGDYAQACDELSKPESRQVKSYRGKRGATQD